MTKITINVSGAGDENSIEEPGVTTQVLDSTGRNVAAGALNAGSAPSFGEASVGALPVMGNVDFTADSGAGRPIAAGPPPEHLFEMSGGEQ